MKGKAAESERPNLLDFIPEHAIEWQSEGEQRVYLIKEKSRSRIVKKMIDWLHRSQFFHIHLDELGSAAWLEADGNRTIWEISQVLRERFGERAEPCAERVAHFFSLLYRNRFVSWKNKKKNE